MVVPLTGHNNQWLGTWQNRNTTKYAGLSFPQALLRVALNLLKTKRRVKILLRFLKQYVRFIIDLSPIFLPGKLLQEILIKRFEFPPVTQTVQLKDIFQS